MGVLLKLEVFGNDTDALFRSHAAFLRGAGAPGDIADHFRSPVRKPWVAEIVDYDRSYTFRRVFMDAPLDYTEANRRGSRGVYRFFYLVPGHTYEVFERVSWAQSRRYFCRVEGDRLMEMGEDEVRRWLETRHCSKARAAEGRHA